MMYITPQKESNKTNNVPMYITLYSSQLNGDEGGVEIGELVTVLL